MVTNDHLFGGYDRSDLSRLLWMVAFNTFLFPAASLLLMRKLGLISSLVFPEARHRTLIYVVCGVFYAWSAAVFYQSDVPPLIQAVVLGAVFTLFLTFFFSLFRNVSIHAGGAGAFLIVTVLACMAAPQYTPQLPMITAVGAGLVGTARMWLGAHDLQEIVAGYLVGMACQLAAVQLI